MRVVQLIGGIVLGLLGAALLYFRGATFYWTEVSDPGKGGSSRPHPVAFAVGGVACIVMAIAVIVRAW